MEEDFSQKTEDELHRIQEDTADNAYVSGSRYHKAGRELERRHQRRLSESLSKPNGVNIGVLNNGTISNSRVRGVGTKQAEKSDIPWWKRPELVVSALTLIIGVLSIPFLQPYFQAKAPSSIVDAPIVTPILSGNATSTINISSILQRVNEFETGLEQSAFLKNYVDTRIVGAGTFKNISRPGDLYLVDVLVDGGLITCSFDLTSEKQLLLLRVGRPISFSGTFTGGYVFQRGWNVRGCELK